MPRKIFISFLGSTNYGKCHYIKASYKSNEVRYIQLATLEYIKAKDWSKADKAYILVTDGERGSYIKNWKDDGHINRDDKKVIKQTGLETELVKMKLSLNIDNIHIKDGNSEKEIWEIFETIYNLLDENDELYIDITHGFRYLPMLTIVLANYGKLLKNISIKSISYGNYESRNFQTNEAQIINLTSFSELQDWTNAVQTFKSSGRTNDILKLLNSNKIEGLNDFAEDIITNRGLEIYKGQKIIALKKELNKYKSSIVPFREIKNEITKKIYPFKQTNIDNGFKAVEFCIEHGLTQQGITLLQEFIVSKVMYLTGITKPNDITNKKARNVFTSALQMNERNDINIDFFLNSNEKKHESKRDKAFIKINKWLNSIYELEFKSYLTTNVFIELSDSIRNDINHAGFRENPRSAKDFSEFLKNKYLITKKIFEF